MSFSQFTTVTPGTTSSQLDSVTFIEGTSSLRHRMQSADAVVTGLTSGAAVTTGRIRCLVRSAGSFASVGLFGMMQTSIAETSNAYWVSINPASSTTTIRLQKGRAVDLDQAAGGGTVLTSGALGFTYAVSTDYALQLVFQRDEDTGQIRLEAWSGTATDFSNLTLRLEYDDASSPYSSGVSMGCGTDSVSSTLKEVWFDKMQMFRV